MVWIHKSTILLCLILIVPLINSLEWSEDDAIYIEDGALARARPEIPDDISEGTTFPPNGNGLESTKPTTKSPPVVTAIPVEIIPGQCVKASECYPILFYQAEDNPELQVVDLNLYKFILSTSNACEPSDLPERARSGLDTSEDIYIWCPHRTFSSKPPRVPTAGSDNESGSSGTADISDKNSVKCGPVRTSEEEELKARVVGGEIAKVGEFPWMVALTNRGNLFCSGSLIDESTVLLAAHCVSHLRFRDLKRIKVLVGDHDIRDPTDILHQERNVSAVIFHKNFTMRTVHSDVGLVKLSSPVEFADNVAPICLSDGSVPYDDGSSYALLSGWGATKEGNKVSTTLMKTTIRIWRHKECVDKYEDFMPGGIRRSMVCAGSVAPEVKDACKGDSGGPLSLIIGDRTEQIGIVSFGIGCGRYPGVFSRVPSYLNWIEKHRSRSVKYFH